jgi:hypothetical protein
MRLLFFVFSKTTLRLAGFSWKLLIKLLRTSWLLLPCALALSLLAVRHDLVCHTKT